MNEKDWNFIFGDLGDPIADIEWYMTQPFPKWLLTKLQKGSKNYVESN